MVKASASLTGLNHGGSIQPHAWTRQLFTPMPPHLPTDMSAVKSNTPNVNNLIGKRMVRH